MQKIFLGMLAVATILFATLYTLQRRATESERQKVIEIRQQAKAYAAQYAEVERQINTLQATLESATQRAAAIPQVASLPANLQSGEPQTNATDQIPDAVANILGSIEFREIVHEAAAKALIGEQFGDLVKELGLTPEQAEKFRELFAQRQLAMLDLANTMPLGNAGAVAMVSQESLTKEQTDIDNQIRALLGDEKYARYEEYQKTKEERTAVRDFNKELAFSGRQELTAEQQQQLTAIMHEENASAKQSAQQAQTATPGEITDETINAQMQQYIDTNKRVRDRAQHVLSQEQLQAFDTYQENQIRQQQMNLGLVQMIQSTTKKKK
jgi:hypothetical protein